MINSSAPRRFRAAFQLEKMGSGGHVAAAEKLLTACLRAKRLQASWTRFTGAVVKLPYTPRHSYTTPTPNKRRSGQSSKAHYFGVYIRADLRHSGLGTGLQGMQI